MKVDVAHINLTGDYFIPQEDGTTVVGNVDTDPNLHELSAFIGALRSSINVKGDVFLTALNRIVSRAKVAHPSRVVVKVSSSLCDNKLEHVFDVSVQ